MPHALPRFERIAHRGAPREFPENSLEGFLRALERGADAVELDVHKTRDGGVVIHHDPDVRTPDGALRPISGLSRAEVESCRLAGGLRVPSLAQALEAIGPRATVYIELKGHDVGAAAAAVASAHGARYALHSFDHDAIRALSASLPQLSYGILLDAGTPDPAAVAAAFSGRDIWAHWTLADAALARRIHARAQRLLAWTVNDPAEADRLRLAGVDGVCTDDVRLLGGGVGRDTTGPA
ncbi:MAG TPA: glycerophosphodiester phosphodiesterase [Gemmatimonadaceae bacterium]|nr:glycerophosphodiester phosphodiesterase [Gemmatimonadaceae bacterium]